MKDVKDDNNVINAKHIEMNGRKSETYVNIPQNIRRVRINHKRNG